MSKSTLFWEVYQRLVDDSAIDGLTQRLVEASFSGPEQIRQTLEQTGEGLGEESSLAEPPAPESAAVYLDRLEVTGFRGIANTTTIQFDKAPGLTVVVGRNGSGKSSLAEALEVLLTGESLRWKNRKQKEWSSGWKNLHHTGRTWIRGTFLLAGSGDSLKIQRSWNTDDYATGTLEVDGEPLEALDRWDEALKTFRPVLSYNEIGTALDGGPSHLFDLLKGILGMEELTEAGKLLAAARKELSLLDKDRKARLQALRQQLDSSDDERAARAAAALEGRKPDLDALLELIVDEETGDTEVAALRRVASLQIPTASTVLAAAGAIRDAVQANEAAIAVLAQMEAETVQILKLALEFHAQQPDADCPVCGTTGALSETWHGAAKEHIARLESSTKGRAEASAALDRSLSGARKLVNQTPAFPDIDLPAAAAAKEAYRAWCDLPDQPRALADHLEGQFDALERAYIDAQTEARTALSALQTEWRPIRLAIESLLQATDAADAAKPQVKALKEAENWLKETDAVLRRERFSPIRAKAQHIWETLRHRSNVSLNDIRLAGTKTSRRVELDVAVDGHEAVALGVMSQGELHAMLLSLFLPRLTLPESPFRFLVVDDPVQAMDPAKVDGLAQVLSDVAKDRQVIVFTHDAVCPKRCVGCESRFASSR